MTKAVTKKNGNGQSIADYIKTDKVFLAKIAEALPKHLHTDKFVSIIMGEMRRNPKLMECDKYSVLSAVMKCAQFGLMPIDGANLAHLVPYNDRKNNRLECQFQFGYKGLMELAERAGVEVWPPQPVFEKDFLEYEQGLNPRLVHKPYLGEEGRGKIIGAYAVAVLRSGTRFPWFMPKADIDNIRDSSPAAKSSYSPWNTNYPAMAMKTPVRQVCKYLPASSEQLEQLNEAVALDEKADFGGQNLSADYEFISGELEHKKPQTIEMPIKQTDKVKEAIKNTFNGDPKDDPLGDEYWEK